jgi:hypothetical protein
MKNAASGWLAGAILCALLPVASAHSPSRDMRTNPAQVAQRLYQAWHLKSQKSALKVADKDAVDKLFGVHWRAMTFEGCHRRDEGGFECVYRDAKNDFSLAMIVDGGVSVGGYNVASLSFSTEE